MWGSNGPYSLYAHKWRIPRQWVYPRKGGPNYGYDPGHSGPMPIVQQKLIDELRELDKNQAQQVERIHRSMFQGLGGVDQNIVNALNQYVSKQMELLLSTHNERMSYFTPPRKLTDDLEGLFTQTQADCLKALDQLSSTISSIPRGPTLECHQQCQKGEGQTSWPKPTKGEWSWCGNSKVME